MSQGFLMTPWGPLIKISQGTESLIGICLLSPVDRSSSFKLVPVLVCCLWLFGLSHFFSKSSMVVEMAQLGVPSIIFSQMF